MHFKEYLLDHSKSTVEISSACTTCVTRTGLFTNRWDYYHVSLLFFSSFTVFSSAHGSYTVLQFQAIFLTDSFCVRVKVFHRGHRNQQSCLSSTIASHLSEASAFLCYSKVCSAYVVAQSFSSKDLFLDLAICKRR